MRNVEEGLLSCNQGPRAALADDNDEKHQSNPGASFHCGGLLRKAAAGRGPEPGMEKARPEKGQAAMWATFAAVEFIDGSYARRRSALLRGAIGDIAEFFGTEFFSLWPDDISGVRNSTACH